MHLFTEQTKLCLNRDRSNTAGESSRSKKDPLCKKRWKGCALGPEEEGLSLPCSAFQSEGNKTALEFPVLIQVDVSSVHPHSHQSVKNHSCGTEEVLPQLSWATWRLREWHFCRSFYFWGAPCLMTLSHVLLLPDCLYFSFSPTKEIFKKKKSQKKAFYPSQWNCRKNKKPSKRYWTTD